MRLGILLALAVSTSALAQDQWLQMNVVKVKPEYVAEFMDLQKNHISPASQKEGDPWRAAWRIATFGNSYTFSFTTPIESFADYDDPGPRDPEIGAKFSKYVADRESHAFIYRADLSKEGAEGALRNIAVVNAMEVAPGRGDEFEAYLEEVLAYMSDPKSGVQAFHVYQKPFGGKVVWWTVLFVENFAYIDGGPPGSRVLGQERMRELGAKQAGLVLSVDRTIWRYLPELSHQGGSATSNEEP